MTLLAAFQVLLPRYSGTGRRGRRDAGRGSRRGAELEGLIGFFVNTLVLRGATWRRTPSFAALLRQVREVALDAYAPPGAAVRAAGRGAAAGARPQPPPLFQVMFALQDARTEPTATPARGGETLLFRRITDREVRSDADGARDAATHLSASFEYSTDLFDAETIARMAGHFVTLLEAAWRTRRVPVADVAVALGGGGGGSGGGRARAWRCRRGR